MKRIVGVLFMLLLLSFALPALLHSVMALIFPLILIVIFVGIGALMFGRRRYW